MVQWYNKLMFDWSSSEKIVLPIAFVINVLIATLICLLTKNKSKKIKRIPLTIITILVIILEIAKQIYFIFTKYNVYALPLHFCSLFIYFYIIANFIKKGEHFGDVMTLSYSIVVIIAIICNPSNVIGESCDNIFQSFPVFHSFFYHFLMILYFSILLASNLIETSKKDFLYICFGIIGYAIIAVPLAYILNANFCNILYSNYSFLESIRTSCGQFFYTIAILFAGMLACIASYLPIFIINQRRFRKENK